MTAPAEFAAFDLGRDILPIFVADDEDPPNPVSFCGTGFLLPPNILVTCWHNVREELPQGHHYGVARKKSSGGYQVSHLPNLGQDGTGTDIALSSVGFEPELPLRLATGASTYGTDVWSFGYPLTDVRTDDEVGRQFVLNARYLEGYVTRAFYHEHPTFGVTPAYELDMSAPAGLSGAPLIRKGSTDVIGMVMGTNDVAQVEEFASVDPDTGERSPELQRIVTFGLALHTDVLRAANASATRGLSLGEYLQA